MSKDSTDTPEFDPEAVLIAQARRLLPTLYPAADHPTLDFDSPQWPLHPVSAPRGTYGAKLSFCELDSKQPFPREFSELLKAFIILSRLTEKNAFNHANSFRYLWEAVSRRTGNRPFTWHGVTADDFDTAEQIMIDRGLQASSVYNTAGDLFTLAKWLDSNDICAGLEWSPRAKDPRVEGKRTKIGREKRLDRLPTRRAIEGLGEIYRVHAKSTRDRLLIRAVGLLLVGGFRISELLTLPANCWVEESHRGRKRYGLRFWNRKARGGVWQWAVRWLSPMGAEMARVLIDEIEDLTRSARAQAAVLENDPTRVTIPGTEGRDELSTREVAVVFGTTSKGVRQMLRYKTLNLTPRSLGNGRPSLMPKVEVEADLLKRRGPLHTLDLGNGRKQSLSETLLIAHQGMFEKRAGNPIKLLVTSLKYSQFQMFLKGRADDPYCQSAFVRFDITEPAGEGGAERPAGMRSMMLRHWLNTMANKAGMSAFQITVWMQRTNSSHTLLYLHSASDIADLTREGVRGGRLMGHHADVFNTLPEGEREEYLDKINAAHQASTGKCTANFAVSHCGMSKACESGCAFYLHSAGDEGERTHLVSKRARYVSALLRIEAAELEGRILQPRQRQLCEQGVAAIDKLLATGSGG